MPGAVLTALVIGNAAYTRIGSLQNPANDAEDVSAQLTQLGFSVQTLKDATILQMGDALAEFGAAVQTSSVGLLFFAGHAFQIDGKNYLAAVDTVAEDPIRLTISSLDLDLVLKTMKESSVRTGLIILDACRNDPFLGRTRSSTSNELAPVFAPKGTLIAFSTSPGQKADDGTGRNGYYTQALLQHIATPNVLVETMFKRVRSTLEELTDGRQTSWEHTSLTGDFRFQLKPLSSVHGYGPMAISDSLFPRTSNTAGSLVDALKTLYWYTQNPALEGFSLENSRACTTDELFVIGRNIYQAACGSAHAATVYIDQFKEKTEGLEESKRKAILDGMLYEIFFDSEGQHRARPKLGEFGRVFELLDDDDLSSSFTFIQNCLAAYANQYFVLPGSRDVITVTVAADSPGPDGKLRLNGIWLDSTNILRALPDNDDGIFFGLRSSNELTFPLLREYLSEQLVIPPHLLTVEMQFPYTAATKMIIPSTHTISKMS